MYPPRSVFSRSNVEVSCGLKNSLGKTKSQPLTILVPQKEVARVVTPVSESTLDPNVQPFAPARQPLAPSRLELEPPPPGTEEPPTSYTPSPEEFPPLSEPSASTPDWMSRTASEHDHLPNPSLSFLDDSQELDEGTAMPMPAIQPINQFIPRSLRPALLPTPSNFPPFGPRNTKSAVDNVGSEGSSIIKSDGSGHGLGGMRQRRFSAGPHENQLSMAHDPRELLNFKHKSTGEYDQLDGKQMQQFSGKVQPRLNHMQGYPRPAQFKPVATFPVEHRDPSHKFSSNDCFRPGSFLGPQNNLPRFSKPVEGSNGQFPSRTASFTELSTRPQERNLRPAVHKVGPLSDFQIPSKPASYLRSTLDCQVRSEGLLGSSNSQISSTSTNEAIANVLPPFKPIGSTEETNIPMGSFSNNASGLKPGLDQTGFSVSGPKGPDSPMDPAEDAEVMDPKSLLSFAPLIEDFPVPEEYRMSRFIGEKLPKINIRQERTELLFFTFYSNLGDALQLVAASLLFERGWRYHKQDCIWLARWPGVRPEEKTSQYEKGLYQYFDVGTWRRIPGWFKLEYSQLADKTLVPEDLKSVYSRYSEIFKNVGMACDKDPLLTLMEQEKEEHINIDDHRLLHCLL